MKTQIKSVAEKAGSVNIKGDGAGKVHNGEPGMKPRTGSSIPEVTYENIAKPKK